MTLSNSRSFFLSVTACVLTLNAQSAFAKPVVSNNSSSSSISGSRKTQESEIVAFSIDNLNLIEASLIDDALLIKRANGCEKLSVKALNRAGKDQSRTLWNLYCFYIVKDVWRSLRHHSKLIGQANLTLEIHADGSYQIRRHALYVPGCRPCIESEQVPAKAQEFWQQIKESIANIEFKQMTIPDKKAQSVSLEIVAGRDVERFPRYSFYHCKGLLVRDKTGHITRGKTVNRKD